MLHLVVHIGSDRYAIPARDIAEVLPLVELKALPGAPRGVAGLLDCRGAVIPVVDLSALALGTPAVPRVSTRLLLVRYSPPRGGEELLGLVAEHVTETLNRSADDFRPSGVDNNGARFLGPVIHDARGLIQRIEIPLLLTEELRAALFPANAEVSP